MHRLCGWGAYKELTYSLASVATLMLLPKAAKLLRGNEQMGFLVTVLVAIIKDMQAFMLLVASTLAAASLAFSLVLTGYGGGYSSVADSLWTSYSFMILGEYDPEVYAATWEVCSCRPEPPCYLMPPPCAP